MTFSPGASVRLHWIWRYGLAVLCVVPATLLCRALPGTMAGRPYRVFHPAVITAAALGGFLPGLRAPLRRIISDLSDKDRVLLGLDLRPQGET